MGVVIWALIGFNLLKYSLESACKNLIEHPVDCLLGIRIVASSAPKLPKSEAQGHFYIIWTPGFMTLVVAVVMVGTIIGWIMTKMGGGGDKEKPHK